MGFLVAYFEASPHRRESGVDYKPAVRISIEAIARDVKWDELGGLAYSLLLLEPSRVVEGDASVLEELKNTLYERLLCEEASRLYRLLAPVWSHVRLGAPYPIVSRMSRLARLYPWLRGVYSSVLRSRFFYLEVYRRVARIARSSEEYSVKGGFLEPTRPLDQCSRGLKIAERLKGVIDLAAFVASSSDLAGIVGYKSLVEGLRGKLHPLLRDPLLLVRLREARLASRLLGFEKQASLLVGASSEAFSWESAGSGVDSIIRSARIMITGGKRIVVKEYRGPAAAKWLLAALLTMHLPKPFLEARARLLNEYLYSVELREKGFKTHSPILIDVRRVRAAYSFIEGVSLSRLVARSPETREYRELGSLLASVHREGYSLWDTNPSNFIVAERSGLGLVDLEQARRRKSLEDSAWDIAMAVYYSAVYSQKGLPARARLLGEGYLEAGGSREALREASKAKYALPFLAVIPFNILLKTRRELEKLGAFY